MENAKIPKFKCDICSNFQTMWIPKTFSKCTENCEILFNGHFCSNRTKIAPVLFRFDIDPIDFFEQQNRLRKPD